MTTVANGVVQSAPVLQQIGNTPLFPLVFESEGVTLYAKAEFLNPSGSIKDRLARHIIADAVQRGVLRSESIILECTSGNTGISFAMVGAALGIRVRILMSDSASIERRQLIQHFGGEVETFAATQGYGTGIELSRTQAAADPRIFLPRQFENPLNALDHEETTAQEIIAQVEARTIDAFVAGYGTGGTITGCGNALRVRYPAIKVIAMEPSEAAMLSGEMPCCHFIEGISGGYLPPLLKSAQIDAVETVSSLEALAMARRLSREFGLLVGTSSGANLVASLRVAQDLGPDSTVVTVLCDRAERYYSTRLFDEKDDSTYPVF